MTEKRSAETYINDAIEILKEMTSDWDTGLDEDITGKTCLVGDLGFESLDVVYLVSAIEQKYGRRDLPFDELLMTDGRYVDDLTASDVSAFLTRHL